MILVKKLYDGFVTKVNDIKHKIPDTRDFLNKANYNTKIKEIVNKIPNIRYFVSAPEFNRLTEISLNEKTKEVDKSLEVKLM